MADSLRVHKTLCNFIYIVIFIFLSLGIYTCTNSSTLKVPKSPIKKSLQFPDTSIHTSVAVSASYNQYWNLLSRKTNYSGITLLYNNGSFYTWFAGKADSSKLLNPNIPMQIASISKTFCATGIMILYKQGKIKLTDSLRKFFPELPYYNISIEQLLSHSSGLPEYTWFCDTYYKDSTQITNSKLIALMASAKPEAYFKPGKRHRYTNTNFVLLASIIEKISGLSYPAFLKQNIFDPLGMLSTRVLPAGTDFNALEVLGHYGTGKPIEPHYLDGTYGDKNIVSTVWDLFRFYKGLKDNFLFPEIYRNEMFRTRWANARRGTDYALGWRKRFKGDEVWMFHSGWWHGFRTNFYINIEKNQCAVVLSNRLSGGFIPANTILSMFEPKEWNEMLKKWGIGKADILEEEE
jgi:CubicO group peptidase (beta-lactamase class C family)